MNIEGDFMEASKDSSAKPPSPTSSPPLTKKTSQEGEDEKPQASLVPTPSSASVTVGGRLASSTISPLDSRTAGEASTSSSALSPSLCDSEQTWLDATILKVNKRIEDLEKKHKDCPSVSTLTALQSTYRWLRELEGKKRQEEEHKK